MVCFLILDYFYLPEAVSWWHWHFTHRVHGVFASFLWGQYVAQLNLIAVRVTLGRGSWLFRLPLLLLLTMIHWISYVSGDHYQYYGSFLIDVAEYEWVTLGAYLLLSVSIATIPWIFTRYQWGWRLVGPDEQVESESRFDLREVFGAFALVAMILGTLRTAGNLSSGDSFLWDLDEFLKRWNAFCHPLIINSILVPPCVWAALKMRLTRVNLTVSCLVWLAISTLLVGLLSAKSLPTICYVCSQSLVTVGSLLLLRWSGLKIVSK